MHGGSKDGFRCTPKHCASTKLVFRRIHHDTPWGKDEDGRRILQNLLPDEPQAEQPDILLNASKPVNKTFNTLIVGGGRQQ
jgi:hypothetical protein|mmetsp:Transcript_57659/g.94667  ORF Transcript_57659/g.94667 Transcript_57659/m.94667 type:complete len:81 (-) Transcript_57659:34-276(-)